MCVCKKRMLAQRTKPHSHLKPELLRVSAEDSLHRTAPFREERFRRESQGREEWRGVSVSWVDRVDVIGILRGLMCT